MAVGVGLGCGCLAGFLDAAVGLGQGCGDFQRFFPALCMLPMFPALPGPFHFVPPADGLHGVLRLKNVPPGLHSFLAEEN